MISLNYSDVIRAKFAGTDERLMYAGKYFYIRAVNAHSCVVKIDGYPAFSTDGRAPRLIKSQEERRAFRRVCHNLMEEHKIKALLNSLTRNV